MDNKIRTNRTALLMSTREVLSRVDIDGQLRDPGWDVENNNGLLGAIGDRGAESFLR